MKKNQLPLGWNENKIQKVLEHYQEQTEEEALAEDEETLDIKSHTLMEVPKELVPAIRELIAKHGT